MNSISRITRALVQPQAVPVAMVVAWLVVARHYDGLLDLVRLGMLFATAFSLGSLIRLRGDTRTFENTGYQLCCGLGILALLIWLSTFRNFGYPVVFSVLSVAVIAWRRRRLRRAARYVWRATLVHGKSGRLFLLAAFAVLTTYAVFGSFPISKFDALTKHIAIPAKVLATTHYDYNVVESIAFADASLFTHMLALYVMAFDARRAPIYLVAALSTIALLFLLRMGRNLCDKSSFVAAFIVLLYGTTPILLRQSTNFYVDAAPLPFLMYVTLYVVASRRAQVAANANRLFFLLGVAFFAKQTAGFMILPLGLAIVWQSIAHAWAEPSTGRALPGRLAAGMALLVAPSLGPMLILWMKVGNPVLPMANEFFSSPYFPLTDLSVPFAGSLGFDLASLLSIVFRTDQHIEMSPGGLGIYLLLLPAAVFVPIFRCDWRSSLVVAFVIGTYLFSSEITGNLRYLLAVFALAIIPVAYAAHWAIGFLHPRGFRAAAWVLVGSLLIAPNLKYIFIDPIEAGYDWYVRFQRGLLVSHKSLVRFQLTPLFAHIPDHRSSILYDSDAPFRGDYPGYFSTLSWHNAYIVNAIQKGNIEFCDVLAGFDYFIRSKTAPVLSLAADVEKGEALLELVTENETDALYRVRKEPVAALVRRWPEAVSVAPGQSYREALGALFREVHVRLEIEIPHHAGPAGSVFIVDAEGSKLLEASIDPGPGRATWGVTRVFGRSLGKGAVLSVESSADAPLRLRSIHVETRPIDELAPLLTEFGKVWPGIARRL